MSALLPAVTLTSSLVLPDGSFAIAVTVDPSSTAVSGIVVLFGFSVVVLGTMSSLSDFHVPSSCLVRVTSTGSVPPSGITVITTLSPTSASSGKPTATDPSSVPGVSSGALGAVVSFGLSLSSSLLSLASAAMAPIPASPASHGNQANPSLDSVAPTQ